MNDKKPPLSNLLGFRWCCPAVTGIFVAFNFSIATSSATAQLPSLPGLPSLESLLPLLNVIKLSPGDTKKLLNAIIFYKKYGEPTLKIFKAAQSGDLASLVQSYPQVQGKLGRLDLNALLAEIIKDELQKQQTNPKTSGLFLTPDTARLTYQNAIAETVFSSGSAFFSREGQETMRQYGLSNQQLSNDNMVLALKCANEVVSQEILKCGNQIQASQVEAQVRNLEIQKAIAYGTAATNIGVGKILQNEYDRDAKEYQDRQEQRVTEFQASRNARGFVEPPRDANGNYSNFPYGN